MHWAEHRESRGATGSDSMSQGITAVDCDGSGEMSTGRNGSIPSFTGGGGTNYWRRRRRRASELLTFRGAEGAAPKKSRSHGAEGAEGAAPKKSTLAAPKAPRRKNHEKGWESFTLAEGPIIELKK